MKYKIYNQDVIEWAKEYQKGKFHALLCDPPYHLTSIVKRFGKKNSAPAKFGTDGVFSRSSKGFMGQEWDGGDVAFNPETWAALGEHLYPGAFGMAFSASRNWHRLAVAIEDAGFIIHPTIFGWLNCLSDDTEILTDKGWASIQDNIVGSKVMCYNVSDSSFQFLDFKERFEYEYQDTAYRIHSDNTDQFVTRNHRCLVEREGKFVFQLAETLEQQEIVPILEDMSFLPFPIHSSEHGRVSQKESLLANLRNRIVQTFKGWKNLETEKSKTSNGFEVSQGEVSKVSGMQEEVLETERMDKEGKKSNVFQDLQRSFTSKGISKTLLQGSFCLDRNKSQRISKEDVGSEQSCLERWSNLLSQAWKLFVNQVCEMSTRVFGYGSQGWVCDGASPYGSTGDWALPDSFGSSTSQRPQPTTQLARELHVVSKQFGTQELRSTWIPTSDLARITPVEYSGKVWCVEVPTGAFVARRNGKIFITGNSQGFPKATNISKQIDKDKNNSRSEDKRVVLAKHIKQIRTQKGISKKTLASWFSYSSVTENWERLDSGGRWPSSRDYRVLVDKMGCNESLLEDVVENERLVLEHSHNGIGLSSLGNAGYNKEFDVSKSTSNLGTMWEGHRYGLQALKPAVEPIIVFQKPYDGRPLDNITQTGAGALNIDGGRIPLAQGDEYTINTFDDGAKPFGNGAGHKYTSTQVKPSRKHKGKVYDGVAEGYKRPGASMYQHKTDWEMQDGGRWPANFLLDEELTGRLDAQSGHLQSGKPSGKKHADNNIYEKYKNEDVDVTGIGDSGGASRFFFQVSNQIVEADPIYYCGKASPKERNAGLEERNNHPTLKPIALAKYLATLLLPPDAYSPRRILVPFSGTASEMIGCALAGWEQVVGIELGEEYVDIAHKRMEYWSSK